MKVHSIFDSLQGEGRFQGFPTRFLRLYGCNLRCCYCDAKESVSGEKYYKSDVAEIAKILNGDNFQDICITGGEPFCQLENLDRLLSEIGTEKRVSIETNGSFDVSVLGKKHREVCFSIDWKTPSSNNPLFENKNIEFLKKGNGWLKFVVSDKSDLKFIEEKQKLLENIEVFVSPVFEKGSDWFNEVQEFVLKNQGLRFQLQLHKILGIE
ncbi:MAG: 7-carboxy-7-deazaguanine synthase QueE [bacterium]